MKEGFSQAGLKRIKTLAINYKVNINLVKSRCFEFNCIEDAYNYVMNKVKKTNNFDWFRKIIGFESFTLDTKEKIETDILYYGFITYYLDNGNILLRDNKY